jgi:AmiR/NasT family two-component response regulator
MAQAAAPKVLIAEDEAIIRLDLKEMLEEEGFSVVGEASDGDAAVRLAREQAPDLVIMDVKMPGMDGLTAAERIVAEELSAVLILTAFSQRDLVHRAAEAGAIGYLVKPFQKSDLVPAIEVALARNAELTALRRESADLNERLEARKVIDRAKGALMDAQGLSEGEAFRFIQKRAMDERRSMRAVADDILAGP